MSDIEVFDGGDPPAKALETLDDVVAVLRATSSAADFSETYDQAVDLYENYVIGQVMLAIQRSEIGNALELLATAAQSRSRYLTLLDEVSVDDHHRLAHNFVAWRDFAVHQAEFIQWLEGMTRAFDFYQEGKVSAALSLLDGLRPVGDETVEVPAMQLVARSTAESLAATVRSATRDWSGARAAFDRAVNYMEMLAETAPESAAFGLHLAKGNAAKMLNAQLVDAHDFMGAVDAASHSAQELRAAAAAADESLSVLQPIVLAQAVEQEANVEQASAEVALERQDWAVAQEHMQRAQHKYQEASRICLRSTNPAAQMLQETFLNTGFQWQSQFRRRLQRESELTARYEKLQRELDELYAAVRRALEPTGITVENRTEMVNSMQQQVEISTRVETNIRGVLQSVPDALSGSGLPEEQVRALSAEALEIAGSSETGPSFLDRVKRFGVALGRAATVVGEAAGPVLAIIKALSVVL